MGGVDNPNNMLIDTNANEDDSASPEAKVDKKYIQVMQNPKEECSFIALADILKEEHVTRRIIEVWKFSEQDQGFNLNRWVESPRMETDLLKAATDDVFFIMST